MIEKIQAVYEHNYGWKYFTEGNDKDNIFNVFQKNKTGQKCLVLWQD